MNDDAADVLRGRAGALLGLKRWDDAADLARQGLAISPDDHDLLDHLAVATMEGGDPVEGHELAVQMVRQQPEDERAHLLLGRSLALQGDVAGAITSYRTSATLAPFDPQPSLMLAEAMVSFADQTRRSKLRRERIDAAAAQVDHTLQLAPSDAASFLVMAKLQLARKSADGARQWANDALAIDPSSHVGHQILGLAAEIDGDIGTAGDHYVDAAKLNPRSETSLANLRNLRRMAPIGGLALYVILRFMLVGGRKLGGVWLGIGIVSMIAVFVAVIFVIPRWRASRRLSERAQRALEIDDQLG